MVKKPWLVLIITSAIALYCDKNPTDSFSAPVITTQPESRIVLLDSSVSFSVYAAGNPAPTFQWYKAGAPLSGETDALYTIPAAAFTDSGTYSVAVSNSEGTVTTDPAVLIVYSLTVQPQADTVSVDSPFTFTAACEGIPNPTCQWRLNGFDIPGATAPTYDKSAATIDDAGSYRLIVTCVLGDLFSEPVTLVVNP
ncbi:MAG: immunoglobulin domain-containing protein [Chitinispirillaceae bacterium]|nr:immunoglobulin domain-containing protein [Chitinispirillaceae bacterium]